MIFRWKNWESGKWTFGFFSMPSQLLTHSSRFFLHALTIIDAQFPVFSPCPHNYWRTIPGFFSMPSQLLTHNSRTLAQQIPPLGVDCYTFKCKIKNLQNETKTKGMVVCFLKLSLCLLLPSPAGWQRWRPTFSPRRCGTPGPAYSLLASSRLVSFSAWWC